MMHAIRAAPRVRRERADDADTAAASLLLLPLPLYVTAAYAATIAAVYYVTLYAAIDAAYVYAPCQLTPCADAICQRHATLLRFLITFERPHE